jgi:hypothetical protein
MKFLFAALMLVSSSAFARQYIQCAHNDSWDRAVINLNGDKSTLFMTTGVHQDDEVRVLKKLFFVGNNGQDATFETRESEVKEVVHVPSNVIGKYSNSFVVVMEMSSANQNAKFAMSCFSSIYDN